MPEPRHGLVLVTNSYPFAQGEEFLESEIEALAQHFDRVVVLASQVPEGAQQTRQLPAGVLARRIGRPRPAGVRAMLPVMARGAVGFARRKGDGLAMHPGKAAVDLQFEGRARLALSGFRAVRDELGLDLVDDLIIYSYWLHVPARVALMVADDLALTLPQVPVRRLVSRGHRFDFDEPNAPQQRITFRDEVMGRFDAIHPVSDVGTAYLQQRFPTAAHKVSTRRLGTRDPGEPAQASRAPFHVVTCSRVLPLKRLDRVAPVLKLVGDELGQPVRWTHVGGGEGLDALGRQARALLGEDAVELCGHVANTELAELYRRLRPSVFLNLSTVEGVPVSIMETLALAIPAVATDVGGTSEIVHDGRNGFLVPGDFTDRQVADVLLKVARMGETAYARLCDQARAVWREGFDRDVVYPAFAAELLQD